MSKQIVFCILPEDTEELTRKILELDLCIIADWNTDNQMLKLDKLTNNKKSVKLLVHNDLPLIKTTYLSNQNVYWIHPMENPVIEYRPSILNTNDNSLSVGRLHFSKKNIGDYDISKLNKTVNNLFGWFRKQYKNNKFNDYYIGKTVIQFYKNNKLLLAGLKNMDNV